MDSTLLVWVGHGTACSHYVVLSETCRLHLLGTERFGKTVGSGSNEPGHSIALVLMPVVFIFHFSFFIFHFSFFI
jgi:hypothetical protein